MKDKARLLVVDDDRRMRAVLTDILANEGYEVHQAVNGQNALEGLVHWKPDVILMDLQMPVMNGIEAIQRIKADAELENIPIIVVTGFDESKERLEALSLGADDFLLKPPHVAELTARVRSLVKVKAYHDHLVDYQKELEERVQRKTSDLREALNQLRVANTRLKKSSLNTIYCLSRAAEYKDEDTGAHIMRIGEYSRVIGEALGLSKDEQEILLHATPMHDIGKIGIPDHILLKPGKLNTKEWRIMRRHTVFGAQILSTERDEFLDVAQGIALSHHEKWDGSGYPNGVKGEAIPISARITAVADVFDALSSARPYKVALSVEKSAEIVAEGRGTHFDPGVVDAFISAKEAIFTIRNNRKDEKPSIMEQLVSGKTDS